MRRRSANARSSDRHRTTNTRTWSRRNPNGCLHRRTAVRYGSPYRRSPAPVGLDTPGHPSPGRRPGGLHEQSHRPPAADPRDHRPAHLRAGLPAVGARDRQGHRPHLAVERAEPPQPAQRARLPPPRPGQAPRPRGPLRPQLRRLRRSPPVPPRPPGRRRRRRHRRAGPGERRGDPPGPRRLLRRRRPLHAPGPGRVDDRGRHPRRRLHRGPGPAGGREGRHRRGRHPRRRGARSRPTPARATRSCCSRPTPPCRRWSSTPPRSASTARSSR